MRPFAVAGMQLALPAAGGNVPRMEKKLDHLMFLFPWVDMVVFSELAACGPGVRNAEPLPGPAERALQAMAAKHGVWLLTGSMFELAEGRTYNTASVIDPRGKVVGRYRKMFPFLPYETHVQAGEEPFVFDVPEVGRFGVSICYDLWFPETSRALVALGAEVILHPSMTTTIDRDVELAMARATAAQNQCYVIDINGVWQVGNGRSILVGPAGDVLHLAGQVEELIPVELDLERVRRERERGLRGLGQPLKSFRDSRARFPVYGGDRAARAYLETLGPLERPARSGTGAGKGVPGDGAGPGSGPGRSAPAKTTGERAATEAGGPGAAPPAGRAGAPAGAPPTGGPPGTPPGGLPGGPPAPGRSET